ncbi:alpha-2-macroglobulin family protein [Sphingobacterium bambusae]|uniref:MG2 domain-containing protein n=1 Tax=Sphingobacterium bambusae TaxID=662858 RepID=A0ABW6BN55_9SPHI|nr:MG2 domain-containing protein [Sphingobacterium bambusae]WPL48207.1 MG2 domain-containing protein [Sphingobacterium bambusae]
MKRNLLLLLLLAPMFLFAQEQPLRIGIDGQWKQIEQLIAIKNYEQTLPILADIKAHAKRNGIRDVYIRAFLAETQALRVNKTDDKTFEEIQKHFERTLQEGDIVQRSVIKNFYALFLESNSHRFQPVSSNRFIKATSEEKQQIIDSVFRTSLAAKAALQQELTTQWSSLFDDTRNSYLMPTLYHLLAYQYLEVLPSRSDSLGEADQLKAEVLAFNKQAGYAEATSYLLSKKLLDDSWNIASRLAELNRIMEEQPSAYNAYILSRIAAAFQERADYKQAMQYVQRVFSAYPNSMWRAEAEKIEQQIRATSIDVQHDFRIPAHAYHPIKVNTRNADSLFIQVFRTTNTANSAYQTFKIRHDSTTHETRLDAPLAYQESIALGQFDDHFNHHSIYKINPLDHGHYTVLLSNNTQFKDDGLYQEVAHSSFTVSDVFVSALLDEETDHDERYRILLIDRNTGKGYANKKVALYETNPKSKARKVQSFTTNKAGEFTYRTSDRRNRDDLDYYDLLLPTENHLISLMDLEIPEHYDDEYDMEEELEGEETAITLTDRSIYRPGQKVYFKAILYNNSSTKGKILAQKKIAVYLHDANGQKVDSLKAETNLFGSANGILQLPLKTLNGRFNIKVFAGKQELHSTYIRLEEYKRPTFKVTFETNKETYKLLDTAVFIGHAESFAGVPIAQANVRYKIELYGQSRNYSHHNLLDSVTQTDQQGKFQLRIPLNDSSMLQESNFSLRYTAEVTSPSGEMQSANERYFYAKTPWNIDIIAGSPTAENRWSELTIATKNPNGQPLPFAGQIHIYKVKEPDLVVADRSKSYFMSADYHLLSVSDYKRYFPMQFDEVLLSREEQKTWVKTYNFNSNDRDTIHLDSTLFSRGSYRIEAFSIQGTDTIRAHSYKQIYDPVSRRVSAKEFLTVGLDSSSYTVGDKVQVRFETDLADAKQLFVFHKRRGKPANAIAIDIRDGKAVYSFHLNKEDVEALPVALHAFIIKNDMAELRSIHIPIKQKDKQLAIQTVTFRDKITPGQAESWRFKIKQNEDVIPAELALSMYDAALDEFQAHIFPHSFDRPSPYYYHRQEAQQHLLGDFYEETNSSNVFVGTRYQAQLYIQTPIVRSYGLWTAGRYHYAAKSLSSALRGRVAGVAIGGSSTVDEVVVIRGTASAASNAPLYVVDGEVMEQIDMSKIMPDQINSFSVLKDAAATALYGSRAAGGVIIVTTKEGSKIQEQLAAAQTRSNLQETAFFFPALYTDEQGDVSVEFNSPEALSKWKLLLFAHGKNLEAGMGTFYTRTQKELMVSPNMPRYFREGDQLLLKATIQNLREEAMEGNIRIEFINPETNEVISARFLDKPTQPFTVDSKKNLTVSWAVQIPMGFPTVQVKIVAASASFSDGEIHELAILPNRVLVSETSPLLLQPNETKQFQLETANKENMQARIQIQSNPILEVIGALDYLNNYPYACTEQLSSKWFSLKMVQYIQQHYPAIANYFSALRSQQTESKLSENSALTELSAEEMPWIRDIKRDSEKLAALSKLFDENNTFEIAEIEKKLLKQQLETGAFPWFEGGRANAYISIRLLEIWGKVLKLDHRLVSNDMRKIAEKLTKYLDKDSLIVDEKASASMALDYLYARHYWQGLYPLDTKQQALLTDKISQSPLLTAQRSAGIAAKSWIVNQLFGKGEQTDQIRNRIIQEVLNDTQKGMYWESNMKSYNAVSLQSYMVEAYKLNDPNKLDALTQWIYYHKQASHWQTTWMTVDAIYALLLANNPSEFVLENSVTLSIDQQVVPLEPASLGQVAKTFTRQDLKKNLELEVQNNNSRAIYGYLNHQYFANETSLSAVVNNLSISKEYLVQRDGKWIVSSSAKLGEKVKVRLIVIAGESFSNLHLKDSRPSGVEPIYQPSGYKYWEGYYFSMKDASTNYFFDRLSKGKHVYEYEVKANNAGVFQSGISTIGSMYDPSVNARASSVTLEIVE